MCLLLVFVGILETLMSRIQMREKPKVIDITRKIGTVETLTEARINCTLEEKVTHWTSVWGWVRGEGGREDVIKVWVIGSTVQ